MFLAVNCHLQLDEKLMCKTVSVHFIFI